MRKLLTKLFGDPNAKAVKRLEAKVNQINELEPAMKKRSDGALAKQTAQWQKAVAEGRSLEDLLPEAFAAVREMARRKLGQRHFDVQLIGGMVLHEAKIAEMRTGEGKTLVATLPVFLNALAGRGVHVVTVNDFLAQRDAGWMAPIYHGLGLSVGVVLSGNRAVIYDPEFINEEHSDERLRHLRPASKKDAYAADITYGTNNEYGFDYLRDNMARGIEELVQRDLAYAIVDEVDSILIDEARTPLIISAPATDSGSLYQDFAKIARQLNPATDFIIDEKAHAVSLNDEGTAKVEKLLGVANLYDSEHVKLIYHLEQALRAEALFKLDKDYVVRDGEVIIVDEFTGRMLPGRRYSEGLHQAIEAKEGVPVLQESNILATISFQNYFRLYDKLAGMTGTAATEAEEFQTVYNLDVVSVPTNQPMIRRDLSDRIYKTQAAKYRAIVTEVAARRKAGQPVLLGTASIEKNEYLSGLLTEAKIPHQILNAKNHEAEAAIVAKAGERGAVTLATNIAGRGTDIVLGEGVTKVGGLHVLGSERHEARRIDNQLRGRSGRQGDPGSSQFYVSLEDDLMRIFGGERLAGIMTTLKVDEDMPIENPLISKAIESAQKRIESHNFDARKQVLQYDDVMNRHRTAIYAKRRQILAATPEKGGLRDDVMAMVRVEVENAIAHHTDTKLEQIERSALRRHLEAWLPLDDAAWKKLDKIHDDKLALALAEQAELAYTGREQAFGAENMRIIERLVYLQILDRLWMEHLETMTHLREGVRWRAIGQRDPLSEYKREAYTLFNNLNASIEREVATTILRLEPAVSQPTEEVETELTQAADQANFDRAESDTGKPPAKITNRPATSGGKVGRNEPCPCGSGLKYKRCGLVNSAEHQARLKGKS
ncbi:preprotein translocase subunit SecA [Candidatus Microgenomates bacterium]|nr:preprotein translocase subunit SecA [Candidatus Microgenomates bacterium]